MIAINRGALVIITTAASVGWSTRAAMLQRDADATPWASSAIERRLETQPAATGVIEDRRGRVLARPVFDRSGRRGHWIIERPYGAPLAHVGLGREQLLPYGIQGNLSGATRAGAESLRPYADTGPWLRAIVGDPVLTAPPVPVVRITIDADLTRAIYDLLTPFGNKSAAVVLDAKSGAVLALVDYPGPDVNGSKIPTARDSLDAVAGVNLPASTMKTLSAAYILTRYPVTAAHEHVCTGDRCSARHGQVRNLEDALNRSCNTWFRLESQTWSRADWLAFLLNTGIEPADVPGLPSSSLVMTGHSGNTMHWPQAIGQQVWTSTVGLAAAYATVTSLDGRRVNASVLVRATTVPDKPVVVPPAVTATIRQMLRSTTQIGTGRPVNETYVIGDAGGKTGTGQVEGTQSDALFVATAPWNNPRWIVAVSIKHGGSGGVAARVAGKILTKVVDVMAPAGAY